MELTPSQKETARHEFDSFCRKVLREEARDDKRDIVLLAYFLDMTDQEIADKLDMVRRTVQYKRAQTLKELKKEMEVTEDGAQSE